MKTSFSLRVALPLVYCTICFSCSIYKENRIDQAILDGFPVPDGRTPAIIISYEVGTLSISELTSGSISEERIIDTEPVVTRNKVKSVIYMDGSSDWLIKKVTPHNAPLETNEVPSSDYDEVSTIKIINNQGYFINSNGDVVLEMQMDVPSFGELIQDLKSQTSSPVKTKISNILSLTNFVSPGNSGSIINNKKLVKVFDSRLDFRQEDSDDDFTYETYADPESGLVVGGKVFDETGKLTAYLVFKYDSSGSEPLLEMIHFKQFNALPDGIEEISTLNNYYENLVIEDHINN